MRIALDYDNTYTRDPGSWNIFIKNMAFAGHEVICVTMRRPQEEVEDIPCKVYYTSRKAKEAYMKALDIKIDVWIDDCPTFILFDASE